MFDLTDESHLRTIVKEVYAPEQTEYRKEIDAQWRVLRGDLEAFVRSSIKRKHSKTWESFEVSQLNFARKITKKRSQAYAESPSRELDNDSETEFYNEKLIDAKAKWEWRTFDIYYNYFRYACMWFQFYEEEGEQKIALRALRPNQFARVVDDKGRTQAFIVHLGGGGIDSKNILRGDLMETNIQDEPEDNNSKTLAVWTRDQHAIIQVEGDASSMKITKKPIEGNEEGVNDLGMIPATFAQEGDSRERPAFNSLADQTVDLNYIMSYIITGTALQTFGNLIVKRPEGMDLPETFGQSLFTYYDIPQREDGNVQTDVDYISPTSNIGDALEVFNTNVARILDENDVKGAESSGSTDNFTSGFDRLLSRMDTTEVICFNQELYVENEKDIYQICKAYSEAQGSNELKSDSVQIIFKKPMPMKSISEMLEEIKLKKELGLIEEWEKFRIIDPNITELQAKEKLKKINEERKDAMQNMMSLPAMQSKDEDADKKE